MKKAVLIILLIVASLAAKSQIDSNYVSKYYFGFSLSPNYSTLITFAIVEISPKGDIKYNFLSRQNWMHQIVGIQESLANPTGTNILKDIGLEGPDVIGDLWKLRYSETPYANQAVEKGWAGKLTIPTEGQMEMLKQFGVETINNWFYGENMYRLLKAMNDPAWVAEYQNK